MAVSVAVAVAAAAALASRAKRNERKLEISWHCHCRAVAAAAVAASAVSTDLCFCVFLYFCVPPSLTPKSPPHTHMGDEDSTGTMRSNRKFFGPSLSYSKFGILFWFFCSAFVGAFCRSLTSVFTYCTCVFITAVIMAKLPINPTTFSLYLYNKNTLTFHFYYYFWRKMYKYNKKYRRHRYSWRICFACIFYYRY